MYIYKAFSDLGPTHIVFLNKEVAVGLEEGTMSSYLKGSGFQDRIYKLFMLLYPRNAASSAVGAISELNGRLIPSLWGTTGEHCDK